MIWLLTGLICAVLFLGLVKLRNMYLVPFHPKKAHIGLATIKLTEAIICSVAVLLAGPLAVIALAIYLGYVVFELLRAIYHWLRVNKPDLFTREF